MPGETSKPVSTISGCNVHKATIVFKQGHQVTKETRGEVLGTSMDECEKRDTKGPLGPL